MKSNTEKLAILIIFIFSIGVLTELFVNCLSFYFLFPIKNSESYGYITRYDQRTIVPLNKYKSRSQAQLALPYEIIASNYEKKELKVTFDELTKRYGYKDKDENIVIDYKFDDAKEFENDYAIVAMNIDGKKKYGTIDKIGRWIIPPKYEFLCSFQKYYTRACIDNEHCGILDKYGQEVTIMTYKTDRLHCKGAECGVKFCIIGKDRNSCNYFL